MKIEVENKLNTSVITNIANKTYRKRALLFLTKLENKTKRHIPVYTGRLRDSARIIKKDDVYYLTYGHNNPMVSKQAVAVHEIPMFHYGKPPKKYPIGAIKRYSSTIYTLKKKGRMQRYATKFLKKGFNETSLDILR